MERDSIPNKIQDGAKSDSERSSLALSGTTSFVVVVTALKEEWAPGGTIQWSEGGPSEAQVDKKL
jgi:hypothetical protein